MKIKQIVLASAMLASVASFAQKDELKKLKKIYDKEVPSANDIAEYKATLNALKPLATAESDKIYFDYYRVNLPSLEIAMIGPNITPIQLAKYFNPVAISEMADVYNATLDYEKKSGKKIYTEDIIEEVAAIKPMLLNGADALVQQKKFKDASSIVYSVYKLDKKDVDMLFYAASYAVNGDDYSSALDYYNELKKLNYSGEKTLFYATNKASKVEENFPNKETRDVAVTAGTHVKPRQELLPSRRGEIYKNIALILISQNKTTEAQTAIADARKENPNDTSLLLSEADLYLKVKDYPNYTKLVNEALAKEPNNAVLVYNLGVISAEGGKNEEAENYYKRAIEIDPNYFDAYVNFSELRLRSDEKYVTEMNKLGTSDKDNKRYDVLKAEREKNFKSILPYIEKAYELKPTDELAKKTLMSIYNALEMTDKYKALKAKQ
jgi:hypothetical protein